jgi:LysR family hydrogen peroxide-inducible transcriptional activator
MDLRDVRHFLAACRTRNFTRAAEDSGVGQSTLSRAIQRLEHELGGPLFARERGHTHLTALGRLVQPRLEELARGAEALRSEAVLHRRLQGSDLRLGVLCSIGPQRLAGFLAGFRAAHPGVDISVSDATQPRLIERLLAGELDAAITALPADAPDRLRAEPLYGERHVVACPPGHRFARRTGIAMRDMDGETYLLRVNCEAREPLGEALRAAGATLSVACLSEREDWIQSLVAAGMGVCFLPEFSAVQPGLVLRPVEDAPVARRVCLATVTGRRWSPPLAAFVDALRNAGFRAAA